MNPNIMNHIDPDSSDIFSLNSQCSEISLAQYCDALNCHNIHNYFKLLNYNLRSFHSNGEVFSAMIDDLPNLPDVLITTESWNNSGNVNECSINNYTGHHTFRPSGRGGGVSVFCNSKYNSVKINELSLCISEVEVCVVKIDFKHCYVVVIGIYRPPSQSIPLFINKLEMICQHEVIKNASLAFIAGDMNINLNNPDSPYLDDYLACLFSLNFLPTISKFTRYPTNDSNSNPANLDHIFVNNCCSFVSGVIELDLTDHLPTFLHYPIEQFETNETNFKIEFRPFTQSNFNKFCDELSRTDWVFDDASLVNNNTEYFITKLNKIYCRCFPLKIKYISYKRLSKPWLTQRLKNLVKTKSDYYKLFKLGIISKNTNDQHKKLVNNTIRRAKQEYYLDAFNRCRNDMRKSWSLINNLMGRCQKKFSVNKIIYDNEICTTESSIAEAFNLFFTNVAKNLQNALPQTAVDPLSFMPTYSLQSFYLSTVSENECIKYISSLKTTKTDVNTVPVKLFKSICRFIVKPVCKLINSSFCYGLFPERFKISKITQIYKSGDTDNPANYRPICTIPYLSKIFEKCLCTRLVLYFNKFNLFTNSQHGFQKGKSTSDALMNMIELIYDSFNDKKFHINVLIHLKKAFDTVCHDLLFRKLYCYGIRGLPLSLLKSYLDNRQQFVKIGGSSSTLRVNPIGLPQGSNLGPILFLIYLNDFPNASSVLKTILFADDSSFSLSNFNYHALVNDLNCELVKINNWITSNKLTINISKTQLLLFTKLQYTVNPPVSYQQYLHVIIWEFKLTLVYLSRIT